MLRVRGVGFLGQEVGPPGFLAFGVKGFCPVAGEAGGLGCGALIEEVADFGVSAEGGAPDDFTRRGGVVRRAEPVLQFF